MIYGIGDLHFDYSGDKPMDIFGQNWHNHEEKIMDNWIKKVGDNDLVLIPGDTSWALKLDQAYYDLKRINKLPGKKVISKGNHDYWWQGLKKMNELGLESLFFLQNNSLKFANVTIYGTRGWISKDSDGFDEDDERIFNRELLRLEMSLSSNKEKADKKIVMLHYPPFNSDSSPNEFVSIMKEYGVDICVYGHLHSEGHKLVVEGNLQGIEFYCISSDFIDFDPKIILGE